MASTTTESITIVELGKWGIRVNNEWINYSKKFTQHSLVSPGATVTAEIYHADSGKKYLNKIVTDTPVSQSVQAAVPPISQSVSAATPQSAAARPSLPTCRDFDKEARGKTRCAAICAAVRSPSGQVFAASAAEYEAWIKRIADLVVAYVFQD